MVVVVISNSGIWKLTSILTHFSLERVRSSFIRIRSAMMYLARRYKVLVDDSRIKRVIVREVGRVGGQRRRKVDRR